MYEYLSHWWQGDLDEYYQLLGLTISQVNKLFKIAQYITGLITVFELIRFSQLMGRLGTLSRLLLVLVRFVQFATTLPNLLLRLGTAVLVFLTGQLSLRQSMAEALWEHVFTAADKAQQAAAKHPLVRFLFWLQRHPVSERTVRIIGFVGFVLFSLGELFTS